MTTRTDNPGYEYMKRCFTINDQPAKTVVDNSKEAQTRRKALELYEEIQRMKDNDDELWD